MSAPAATMPISNLAVAASDLALGQSVRYRHRYRLRSYYSGPYYGYGAYGYGGGGCWGGGGGRPPHAHPHAPPLPTRRPAARSSVSAAARAPPRRGGWSR